jgi:hypothetical protein
MEKNIKFIIILPSIINFDRNTIIKIDPKAINTKRVDNDENAD